MATIPFKIIKDSYTQKFRKYKKDHLALTGRIVNAEVKINRLNDEIHKLELKYPHFIEHFLTPLAIELLKFYPDRHYEILGPFGLSNHTAIHFYKNGITEKHFFEKDNCVSITFSPGQLPDEFFIVDYSNNTGQFPKGSIGDVNGMNYAEIKVPSNATIEWFVQWIH